MVQLNQTLDDKARIGRRIKMLRAQYNLSQAEMASNIGVTSKAVSAYEGGRSLVSTRVLIEICKQFKLSLSYFDK